ncbi:alcohol dehydrogenase [Pseudomonas fluorescens]|uniref:Alcohol dehydrogenase n=1 Tax=Pseudomonas fluorescens TaxID=294 RepID=A0A327MXE0_PSEFL|nr:iron-containing alcohol dehydrogenase [Pseudomonas fluorescens]RAI64828.1 alcohol dehydrogenase [Pseudomonas fluorescens]
MSAFVFQTPPRIICELGAANRLHELATDFQTRSVFFVTDPGILKTGIAEQPIAALREAGITVTVFSDVQPDPPEVMVMNAVRAAIDSSAEMVIGFGGGSTMDTAKLIALLVKSPQPLDSIYGTGLAKGTRLPLIQVPTTAGTGSEVTPISILTTPKDEKKGVVSPLLLPDVALLDGTLTLGVPPAITAMTGIDAMVHAIESFTSKVKKNCISDALGIKALNLLYSNIHAVVEDGQNAEARERMLLGSTLAGMAFANAPVAAIHALAYPLGGLFHLPHGLSNSLMLSEVLKFNLGSAMAEYAALGRSISADLIQASDQDAASEFVRMMEELVTQMPFAKNLREAGIPESAIELLARDAMNQQRLLVNNPREVTFKDALNIYRAAY